MEQKQRFDSVKERTLECLRQVVLVDANRRNEIDAWLEQALDNGDLELYFAEREGRSFEDLSSVAKQLKAGIDAETIKAGITQGLFGVKLKDDRGTIGIGGGDTGETKGTEQEDEGEESQKPKDSFKISRIGYDHRRWRTMLDFNYESEYGDRASFRVSVSRWSIPDQKRSEKENGHNKAVAKVASLESFDKDKESTTNEKETEIQMQ